jgi:simple sugar transport system substrate-binding protein/ribose transport system substrate-binding protein
MTQRTSKTKQLTGLAVCLITGSILMSACSQSSDATAESPATNATNTPAASSAESTTTPEVGPIAVDIPRNDSDFWTTYADYVPAFASELGIELITSNSQNDVQKLVSNSQTVVSQGARAIVMAPQDTGAIATTLDKLSAEGIPVVTIDTRPDKGKVIMGGLANVNGRDRHDGFTQCMAENYPGVKIVNVPTEWDPAKAAAGIQTALTQNPDLAGIYTPAGGVFLSSVLQTLKSKERLIPVGQEGHIVIVSTDGVPEELEAIREGFVDATVSQPCDLYAKFGLYYAQAALQGQTFTPGPTDHGSTIVDIGNGNLEDQLPGPLVTKDNVDDPSLWANQ